MTFGGETDGHPHPVDAVGVRPSGVGDPPGHVDPPVRDRLGEPVDVPPVGRVPVPGHDGDAGFR